MYGTYLLDNQPIGEGRNSQHVQESGFGHTNFVTSFNQVNVLNNFNCTLGNLGGDVQSLEERSFLRSQSSVLGRNLYIQRSNSSSPGRSFDLICQNHVSDSHKVFLGENESNISLDMGQKQFQLGIVLQMTTNSFSHHGILSHKDDGMASKSNPNLLHLLRSDIVSFDLKRKQKINMIIPQVGNRWQKYILNFS